MYISDNKKYVDISTPIIIYNYYVKDNAIELITPGSLITIPRTDNDYMQLITWIDDARRALTRDNCPSKTMKQYICNYLEYRIENGEYI